MNRLIGIVRKMLDQVFDSDHCDEILNEMNNIGLIHVLIPDLFSSIGISQNKYHNGMDIFEHTMLCMQGICTLPELNTLGDEAHIQKLFTRADKDLKLAVLFHDLGKTRARRWDPKTGDYTFHGHEEVSATMAERWMEQWEYPRDRIKRVVSLVSNHMFSYPPKISDAAVRRLLKKFEGEDCTLEDVLRLRIADRYGNSSKDGSVPRYYPGLLERIEKLNNTKLLSSKTRSISPKGRTHHGKEKEKKNKDREGTIPGTNSKEKGRK